jgi:epoxide hydrolase
MTHAGIRPSHVHWTDFDRGGHVAAMENPEFLVGRVRAYSRGLRSR